VGEAPGAEELTQGQPFVGLSGIELALMLGEAGLRMADYASTNVAFLRPPGGDINNWIASTKTQEAELESRGGIRYNGRVIAKDLYAGVRALEETILEVKPTLILALGNAALFFLTGEWGIGNWRGSILDNVLGPHQCTVIPTYNPAGVLRQFNLRRVCIQDFRRARGILQDGVPKLVQNFLVAPSFTQVTNVIDYLMERLDKGPLRLAVDIETRNYHTACIGFAWSKTDALCIPLMKSGNPNGYWSFEEEAEITFLLYQLLTHPNVEVEGQNFLYDAQYIHRFMYFVPRLRRDTMLAQHVCFLGLPKSLDFIASMYCEHYRFWKEDGKTWAKNMDERILWRYNCEDCVRTYECSEALDGVVRSLGLDEQYDFQMRLWWATFRMMERGLEQDESLRAQLQHELHTYGLWLLAEIEFMAGMPLNPKSPKQMKEFFYGHLQLRPEYKRGKKAAPGKVRQPSCDDECLNRVAQREPLVRPLVDAILNYRSVSVYGSTFLGDCRDGDGLVRCFFNPAGTVTLRYSSAENAFGSGMNLQNIPGKEK
jgi:DNA polymerase